MPLEVDWDEDGWGEIDFGDIRPGLKRSSRSRVSDVVQDTSSQLSPQSAFWAIAAIALATMADLPVRVCGYPKEATFYLKASPLMCLFDVPYMLSTLISAIQKHGIVDGYQRGIHQIIDDKLDKDPDQKHSGSPKIVRLLLFLFGLVPQAIKIFSAKGAVVTQIIAGCYLSSFFIEELILIYARRSGHQEDNTATTNNSRFQHHIGFQGRRIVFSVFAMTTVYVWIMYIWINSNLVLTHAAFRALYLVQVAIHAFDALTIYETRDPNKSKLRNEIFVFLGATLFTSIVWPLHLVFIWYRWRHSDASTLPRVSLLIMTGAGLFCYYYRLYDAGETYQPAWTKWLG